MPLGGTIDLKGRRIRSEKNQLGDRIVLEIHDHGCGMDDRTRKQLFDPFFTTKEDGSGLGMPIVANLVEHSGGTIEVDTKLGQGTTMRIILPSAAR